MIALYRYSDKSKDQVKKSTIINVYHLEDENPDKLIKYSDYIAISIPELRLNVSKQERYKITSYIAKKAKSLNKKVHLLGCTELKYLKDFRFCDSCDSTAWQSLFRYGGTTSLQGKKVNINQIRDMANGQRQSINDAYYCALFALKKYETHAGRQN